MDELEGKLNALDEQMNAEVSQTNSHTLVRPRSLVECARKTNTAGVRTGEWIYKPGGVYDVKDSAKK